MAPSTGAEWRLWVSSCRPIVCPGNVVCFRGTHPQAPLHYVPLRLKVPPPINYPCPGHPPAAPRPSLPASLAPTTRLPVRQMVHNVRLTLRDEIFVCENVQYRRQVPVDRHRQNTDGNVLPRQWHTRIALGRISRNPP